MCVISDGLFPQMISIQIMGGGIINQNIGYPGAEDNVEPLIVPKEGTVFGPDVKWKLIFSD